MAILILEHGPDSGARRLATALRDVGHRLTTIRLHEDQPLPPDLDDVDGIVLTGGPASANDDDLPWLAPEMELIREAHEVRMPVVGLCLGCQILGRTFGGAVGPVVGGACVGWIGVDQTEAGKTDPLHAGIPWRTLQPHWNRECVTELPAGAESLASSGRYPHAAWRLGLRTYAFQSHPEIGRDAFAAWARTDPNALDEAGTTLPAVEAMTEEQWPTFLRQSDRLFEQIGLLLMPVDRRFAGIAKDIRH